MSLCRFNKRREVVVILASMLTAFVLQACTTDQTADKSSSSDKPAAPSPVAANAMKADAQLLLCPKMSISNAPEADGDRRVKIYTPYIDVKGVVLATAPVKGACLSSGFGMRTNSSGKKRLHKGLDYHQRPAGSIYAAGDGVIIEAMYRDDYGNMVLIDHGAGVYTRYAHLVDFANNISEGARVSAGTVLGEMGNTSKYKLPIHLHFELLLGDYKNPKGSFGLEPQDPFKFPAAKSGATN